MSRSRKKLPIWWTCAGSAKREKSSDNRKYRRTIHKELALYMQGEIEDFSHFYDVSNEYDWTTDGKMHGFGRIRDDVCPDHLVRLMRK